MLLWLFLVIFLSFSQSYVYDLDVSNFETITQAKSATSESDWLINFYAPWCRHSQEFEATFFQASELLSGNLNFGRVDVPANKDLGTRFDIHGFPLIKLISKGQIYSFHGRRSVEEIVEFATEGFHIQEPEEVPHEFGYLRELGHVYRHAWRQGRKDLIAGNFYTVDVFLVVSPPIFVFIILCILFFPVSVSRPHGQLLKFKEEDFDLNQEIDNDQQEVVEEERRSLLSKKTSSSSSSLSSLLTSSLSHRSSSSSKPFLSSLPSPINTSSFSSSSSSLSPSSSASSFSTTSSPASSRNNNNNNHHNNQSREKIRGGERGVGVGGMGMGGGMGVRPRRAPLSTVPDNPWG